MKKVYKYPIKTIVRGAKLYGFLYDLVEKAFGHKLVVHDGFGGFDGKMIYEVFVRSEYLLPPREAKAVGDYVYGAVEMFEIMGGNKT